MTKKYLRDSIANISRNKRIKAVVIECMEGLCTVRIVGSDRPLRNLQIIGGPVSAGQTVFVDYSSGTPVVQADSKLSDSYIGQNFSSMASALPRQSTGAIVDPEVPDPGSAGAPADAAYITSGSNPSLPNALSLTPVEPLFGEASAGEYVLSLKFNPEHFSISSGSLNSIFVPEPGISFFTYRVDGALAVAENVAETLVVSSAITITKITAYVDDPGTAGSTIVDIHKNGTTIFTTQANRPEIAFDGVSLYSSEAPDVVEIDAFDVLTLDIDSIGTSASSLTVTIEIEGNGGGEGGAPVESYPPAWKFDPDIPPETPNAMDDEFDGTSLDAKWTIKEAAGFVYTTEFSNSVFAVHGTVQKNRGCFFLQPISGSAWRFRMKTYIEGPMWNFAATGFTVGNNSSNKYFNTGIICHSSYGYPSFFLARTTGVETYNNESDLYNFSGLVMYLECELSGTNLIFRASTSGLIWRTFCTEALATHVGSVDRIGLWTHPYANDAQAFTISYDWFRRMA